MQLFQSYYDDDSKKYLDASAEPIDVSFNLNRPLFEYEIFRTLLDTGVMDPDAGPVGLISWKFQTKTLVTVGEFSAFDGCGRRLYQPDDRRRSHVQECLGARRACVSYGYAGYRQYSILKTAD